MSKPARGKGAKGNAEEKENLVKYMWLLRSALLSAGSVVHPESESVKRFSVMSS